MDQNQVSEMLKVTCVLKNIFKLISASLLRNSNSQITVDMASLTIATNNNSSHCQFGNCTIRPKEQVSVWRQFVVLVKRSMTSMCRNMVRAISTKENFYISIKFILCF